MNRLLTLAIAALIAFPAAADAQKRCVKGKPCGNTCIAANKTCRVATAPARAEPDANAPWVASSQGQVYYKRGCSNANGLAPANRIYFRTEEEARGAGYRRSTSRGC